MRLTDGDNVIEKRNYFNYCFDRVDGIPLKDIVNYTGMSVSGFNANRFATSAVMSRRSTYDMIKSIIGRTHRDSIEMYVFRDRNCYGNFMHRYNKDRCVRFDISNVEYDFDTNNGLLMINGNLLKELNPESFVVGDLRIGNYSFVIDCVVNNGYDEYDKLYFF